MKDINDTLVQLKIRHEQQQELLVNIIAQMDVLNHYQQQQQEVLKDIVTQADTWNYHQRQALQEISGIEKQNQQSINECNSISKEILWAQIFNNSVTGSE